MIYSPQRFCFIHVPRTGGNSIHSAIATSCAGRDIDLLLSTCDNIINPNTGSPTLWLKRHSRAAVVSKKVPDWDSIFRFAITRPVEDIIESQLKLLENQRKVWESGQYIGTRNPEWVSLVEGKVNPRSFFESQWRKWGDPVSFYCQDDGKSLGVKVYQFAELKSVWPEICERCLIPRSPLPHLNAG